MKSILNTLVISLLLFVTPVFSGEVTFKKWYRSSGILIVTYYHGESSVVECIAFNQEGKLIGGGSAHPNAGVARVTIQVPKKYAETELKVSCK